MSANARISWDYFMPLLGAAILQPSKGSMIDLQLIILPRPALCSALQLRPGKAMLSDGSTMRKGGLGMWALLPGVLHIYHISDTISAPSSLSAEVAACATLWFQVGPPAKLPLNV